MFVHTCMNHKFTQKGYLYIKGARGGLGAMACRKSFEWGAWQQMFTDMVIKPRLQGKDSGRKRTSTVRISLAFTRELMEPFQTEPLAVPELVHLEGRSRMEPNEKALM